MKCFLLILILCIISTSKTYAQDFQTQYNEAFSKIKRLQIQYKTDFKKSSRQQLIATCLQTADLLIHNLPNLPQELVLPITYRIAQLYFDAGECGKSSDYYRKCLAMRNCETQKYNRGLTYKAAITRYFANDYCTATPTTNANGNTVFNVIYNGKGMITYEAHKLDTTDKADLNTLENMPYLSNEIDSLQQRLFVLNDSTEAIQYFKKLLGKEAIVDFRSPFLIINVGTEIAGIDSEKQSNAPDYSHSAIEALPGEIKLIRRLAADSLYRALQPEYILPLYIFNGNYGNGDYRQFVEFCNQIHFRYPGQRLGYRNEIDNSIVVWHSSGNGTLAHELSHDLLHLDFPEIPHWLDEGMASMQEETDLHGNFADNWRLVYIKEYKERFHRHFSLDDMVSDYGPDPLMSLVHDCYARYFCMYLKRENKLNRFYKQLRMCHARLDSKTQKQKLLELYPNEAWIQHRFEQYLNSCDIPPAWNDYMYKEKVKRNLASLR